MPGGHPLLGRRLLSPALDEIVFDNELGASWPAFIDDHRDLRHGAAAVACLSRDGARRRRRGPRAGAVRRRGVQHPRGAHPARRGRAPGAVGAARRGRGNALRGVQPGAAGRRPGRCTPPAGSCRCRQCRRRSLGATRPSPPGAVQERCAERIDGDAVLRPTWRTSASSSAPASAASSEMWRRDGEALGESCSRPRSTARRGDYGVHPALLDACFHVLGAAMAAPPTRSRPTC